MLRVLILLSLLVLSRCLAAEPLKLDHLKAGSQVFSNVTVVGANATDLFITHAKGSANVKLKYLDPELQKRFGYDPDAAAQAEQQQAKQERRYETTVAASIAGTAKNKEGPKPTSDESLADPVSEKSPLGKPA